MCGMRMSFLRKDQLTCSIKIMETERHTYTCICFNTRFPYSLSPHMFMMFRNSGNTSFDGLGIVSLRTQKIRQRRTMYVNTKNDVSSASKCYVSEYHIVLRVYSPLISCQVIIWLELCITCGLTKGYTSPKILRI